MPFYNTGEKEEGKFIAIDHVPITFTNELSTKMPSLVLVHSIVDGFLTGSGAESVNRDGQVVVC